MSERFYNYKPPIAQELRDKYEGAMGQELRWQNGMQVSDRPETLLEHIDDLFEIDDEVAVSYPNLSKEVDRPEKGHMFYIHDGGEFGGLDLSHSDPDYAIKKPRIKRRERATFRYITGKYIDDIELKAYTRGLYKRNLDADPDDNVAQYVHMLDKVQAIRFGTKHVFPASRLRKRDERLQQINHDYGITTPFAQNLFRNIELSAQEELLDFMDKTMLLFREAGYREDEVNYYRNQMRTDLLSYREVEIS